MVQLRKKQKRMLKRIVIASILTIFLAICSAFDLLPVDGSVEKYVMFICYLVPYLIIGYDVLRKAAKGIANGQALDENFLMAIATIGAMALGVTYIPFVGFKGRHLLSLSCRGSCYPTRTT